MSHSSQPKRVKRSCLHCFKQRQHLRYLKTHHHCCSLECQQVILELEEYETSDLHSNILHKMSMYEDYFGVEEENQTPISGFTGQRFSH